MAKGIRVKVTLECKTCGSRNYSTTKSKRNTPGKLELMKYCPKDRKHTLHRETK